MPPKPTSKSDLIKDLKSTYKKLGKQYMSVNDYQSIGKYSQTIVYTGVSKDKNIWVAELRVKGGRHRLYGFETAEEAFYEGRLKLEEEYLPKEVFEKMQKKRQQKKAVDN